MISAAVKIYGTEQPPPKQRLLTAGSVTATLENGQLRWIRIGAAEAIRAISFVVRSRNWATPVPEIGDLKVALRGGGFRVTFTATCRTDGVTFTWRGDFSGKPDGSLRCIATGSPDQDFFTGRTGFVVLHPLAGFAGGTVTIEHADGTVEKTTAPSVIDPAQPFFTIRAMTHSPMRGVAATIRMQGDTWETEDQRNWTDASFKTYSRPLALPWPYLIKAGEEVRHSVTLSFTGKLPKGKARTDGPVIVRLGPVNGRMPRLGLSVLPEDAEHAADAAETVKAAGVQHLNCRIDLRNTDWRQPLAAYRNLAKRSRAEIVLEVILADGVAAATQLAGVAKALKAEGLRPAAVVATAAADLKSYPPGTPTPAGVPSWQEIDKAARKAFPRARIGGGMLSNFTELNRKRPPKRLFDFITHATSGLVHAADDRSVMETLEALPHIIRSGRRIAGRAPLRIGPAHIGNSFNPYGASYAENPENERMTMARVDPRHRGLFGAAWHLGYLAQAAAGGVEAVTMASPVGEFGIAWRKLGHSQPWFDENQDAEVYPIFHVIRGLAAGAESKRVRAQSSDPARLAAIAWGAAKATHLWLANLRETTATVRLKNLPAGTARMSLLDEDSFEGAARDLRHGDRTAPFRGGTLTLKPFAVARLVVER